MKIKILIENEQDQIKFTETHEVLISKAIKYSYNLENLQIPSEVSVILTNNINIREINKDQRNIDKATDVLSFPMIEIKNGEIKSQTGDYNFDEDVLFLGDIVISMELTKEQAEEYGHSFERELAFLVTHGMFHILGYDHMNPEDEKIMIGKQEEVLTKLSLGRG